jgi:two-component system, cell cycle sensor histidine kinase and response regulator CckA
MILKRNHDCKTLERKLELAEQVLDYSNRNIQLTMEILAGSAGQIALPVHELAQNGAAISELIQTIREQVETDKERELLEAASASLSRTHSYAEWLQSFGDRQGEFDATAAISNIVLPQLLDNSSWKAYLRFITAQANSSGPEAATEDLRTRTRQIVRAHQEMKSAAAERKRIAERLSQLASIIECSSDAIIIHTLDGAIVSWNAGAQMVYGYSASEVLGRSRSVLIPPGETDDLPQIAETLKRGEPVKRFETVHVRKGGRRIDVSMTISPVKDASDQIVGAVAIARDVSDRKLLETQLRQAQKMEAIGQLAGGIAHDFNNLLSVINGYCDLLEEEVQQNATADRNLEQIKKAGERAASLTRQLLAFSRQQVLEPTILDLNAVVVDLEKMLRRIVGEDVEFRTRLNANLGSVKADRGQIEQVIMNLIVNARDAMPNGGRLIVETTNALVDEDFAQEHGFQQPGCYVRLTVADNGIGMDAQTQLRIFEPFFTTKEVGKGTGLGLSTVYGVITQSGGVIEVRSQLGRGTTFDVYLPALQEPVKNEAPHSRADGDLCGTETILLVEDEEALRDLTRDLLIKQGYRLLEAGSPERAIQIANEYSGAIDLLLTDVIMPRMNGNDLARKLLAGRPDMKIVYMSGYAGFKHSRVLDSHVVLLAKPFKTKLLLRKLREALASGLEPQMELA